MIFILCKSVILYFNFKNKKMALDPITELKKAAHVAKYPAPPADSYEPVQTEKVALIPLQSTIQDYLDITFDTDVMAAMVSQSIETTLATKATTAALTAVSQSIETTLATKPASGSNAVFNTVTAASNGLGQNFKVGDDAWIGDRNVSNTIVLSGIQDATSAILQFGSGSQPCIAHLADGASFPAVGSPQAITGSLLLGHNGRLYFFNGTSSNSGWAQVI